MPYFRRFPPLLILLLLISVALTAAPAQAGIIQSLLKTTGLDALLGQLLSTTGIDLEAPVMALDELSTDLAGGDAAALNLSAEQQRSLAAMDLPEPLFTALQASGQEAAALTAVARAGNDQPALSSLSRFDPSYDGSRVQTDGPACSDGDGDGVCDQEDQCLKTPPHSAVMANGCHLEGPVALRLEGVIFLPGSAELTSAAAFALTQTVALIQQSAAQRIQVAGHTDAQGAEGANLRLSQQRAQAVALYLQRQGVAGERLVVTGFGERRPLASNDTEVGRARNRRVELQILESASSDQGESNGN